MGRLCGRPLSGAAAAPRSPRSRPYPPIRRRFRRANVATGLAAPRCPHAASSRPLATTASASTCAATSSARAWLRAALDASDAAHGARVLRHLAARSLPHHLSPHARPAPTGSCALGALDLEIDRTGVALVTGTGLAREPSRTATLGVLRAGVPPGACGRSSTADWRAQLWEAPRSTPVVAGSLPTRPTSWSAATGSCAAGRTRRSAGVS